MNAVFLEKNQKQMCKKHELCNQMQFQQTYLQDQIEKTKLQSCHQVDTQKPVISFFSKQGESAKQEQIRGRNVAEQSYILCH